MRLGPCRPSPAYCRPLRTVRRGMQLPMHTTKVIKVDPNYFRDEELRDAADYLRRGEVVAFPTETVYGLGANALDGKAVQKIFAAKNRPNDNPLIVHIADMADLGPLVSEIPPIVEPLLKRFWPGALTVLFKRSPRIPRETAADLPTVGIRMPSHPIARRLIALAGVPVAAPSANLSGRPSPTTAHHVVHDMTGRIPMIIDGGASHFGVESTVIDIYADPPIVLRPGGVTVEHLRQFLPNLAVYKKDSNKDMEAKPPTPGLNSVPAISEMTWLSGRYRHYSPDAKVILLEGTGARISEVGPKRVAEMLEAGRKVGVIVTHHSSVYPQNSFVIKIGEEGTPDAVAHGLFNALRTVRIPVLPIVTLPQLDDEHNVDLILVEGIAEGHEGLAVMNRIRKAASTVELLD